MDENFNWQRQWYQLDANAPVSENGLLSRPLSLFQRQRQEQTKTFVIQDLLDKPCLILLSEPAMGKSYTVQQLEQELQNTAQDVYCFHDLKDVNSATDLVEMVINDNPVFQAWLSAEYTLHLFLDSLDEPYLQSRTLLNKLTQNLSHYKEHLSRLKLRIFCRTAEWTVALDKKLESIEPFKQIDRYQLAPLSMDDIIIAAEQRGFDANAFVRRVEEWQAMSLAARPITLKILLDEFQLPATHRLRTRVDLYHRGCLRLCDELDDEKQKAARYAKEKRLIVAGRVAAMMLLTGHNVMVTDPMRCEPHQLSCEHCEDGREVEIDGTMVTMQRSALIETLRSSLFRGGLTCEWIQRTFLEYLAAWYMIRTMSLPQIRSAIYHEEQHVYPKLHEVAAWLADFNSTIFDWLLETDPHVLMQGDVRSKTQEQRHQLTKRLLQQNAVNQFVGAQVFNQGFYALACDELHSVLIPFIENQMLPAHTREMAITIASNCEQTGAGNAIVAVALAENEPFDLREWAAYVTNRLYADDPDNRARLKPLAAIAPEDKAKRALKLRGIDAVWPEFCTAEELFTFLEHPPIPLSENVYARLPDFWDEDYTVERWSERILPHLPAADLPVGLQWLARQPSLRHCTDSFADLQRDLIRVAWHHLDDARVLDALIETLIAVWKRHDTICRKRAYQRRGAEQRISEDELFQDQARRQSVAAKLLSRLLSENINPSVLVRDVPYLDHDDIGWLLAMYDGTNSAEIQRTIAHMWAALRITLQTDLDSDTDIQTRQSREATDTFIGFDIPETPQLEILEPSPQQHVTAALDNIHNGDYKSWRLASQWIPRNEYDQRVTRLLEYKLDALPVWSMLSEEEQAAFRYTAPNYLQADNPTELAWQADTSQVYLDIIAACRAFLICVEENRLDEIEAETIARWASPLTYHFYKPLTSNISDETQASLQRCLLALYTLAPEKVIDTFRWIVQVDESQHSLYLNTRLDFIWNEAIAKMLLEDCVSDARISIDNRIALIGTICSKNYALIQPHLLQWFEARDTNAESRRYGQAAAMHLLVHSAEQYWDRLYAAFLVDDEFGRNVIVSLTQSYLYSGKPVYQLSDEHLGDYLAWLYREFSLDQSNTNDNGTITPTESVRRYFWNGLRVLAERGTIEARDSVFHMAETLQDEFGRFTTVANVAFLNHTWEPLNSSILLQLFQNPRRRAIQTGSQLLNLLSELLNKLTKYLQQGYDGNGAAIDLWSEFKVKDENDKLQLYYAPLDEDRFSDYVWRFLKRELEGSGIVINREVQVRRRNYTDLLLQIHCPSKFDPANIVQLAIEVKCCWNTELMTNMSSQLVNRYMLQNNIPYGIYLVGRYHCAKWTGAHVKTPWDNSRKIDWQDAEKTLSTDAKSFSTDGRQVRLHIVDVRLQ